MIRQAGSTILQQEELKQNYKLLREIFPYLAVSLAAIPTYIGGFFSFLIAAKGINLENLSFKKISAKYKNGILTVSAPKAEIPEPQKIEVR